jgi:hypothetical protein
VYDKGFFVRLDIDMDSDEGLGTTGRLKSQPKNNYTSNRRVLTYEKFSFGLGFCLRTIESEPAIVTAANLSWMWGECEEAGPYRVAESLIVDVLLRVGKVKVEDLVDMKVLIEDEVVSRH